MDGIGRLADLCLLDESERRECWLMVFQAYNGYMDESGTDDTKPIIAVAGWLSTFETWVEFEKEWKRYVAPFGGDFHSTDFWARHSYGADWPNDKRLSFVKGLAEIICKYSLIGVGFGFPKEDYNVALSEEIRRVFRDPYYYCVGACASFLISYYEQIPLSSRPPKPLRFMFDRKNGSEWYAAKVFYQAKTWFDRDEILGDMGFGKREDEPALQAADLLVGEMRRFYEGESSEVLDLLRSKCHALVVVIPKMDKLKEAADELIQRMKRGSPTNA